MGRWPNGEGWWREGGWKPRAADATDISGGETSPACRDVGSGRICVSVVLGLARIIHLLFELGKRQWGGDDHFGLGGGGGY